MSIAKNPLAVLACAAALCAAAGSADAQGSTDYVVAGKTVTRDPAIAALVPPGLNGTIRAVTAATNIPFEYLNEKNELVGIEIDVAKAVAAKMGVKIVFDNIKFDAVIPSLQANRYDLAAAGMGDTAKREEILNFINWKTLGHIVLSRDADKTVNTIMDLCGKRVSRVNGDAFGPWLEEELQPKCDKAGKGKVDIKTFPDLSSALMSVKGSASDAQITGLVNATNVTTSDTHKGVFRIIKPANSPRGWKPMNGGFAVIKSNQPLTKAVELAMKAVQDEGVLQAIADSYGYPNVLVDKVVVNQPIPGGNIGGID